MIISEPGLILDYREFTDYPYTLQKDLTLSKILILDKCFVMEKLFIMPGIRFHPTDDELVMYYLKRKVMGRQFPLEAIYEIDLYKFEPWDLREMPCSKSKDRVWFFFCSPDKKYATGLRKNRATNNGFWKVTGNDKPILYESRTVGMKKSLVFHRGKAPHGDRTDWVMHEYRLEDKELSDASISQDAFVLCKIFKKSGRGPKNGEQYGAPFKEEDWDDDGEGNDSLMRLPCAGISSSLPGLEDRQNEEMISSALESGDGHNSMVQPSLQQSVTSMVTEQHPSSVDHDNIVELLLDAPDEDCSNLTSNRIDIDGVSVAPDKSNVQDPEDLEIFNGLGAIAGHVELSPIEMDCPKHLEDENVQCQVLPGFGGWSYDSYLELNDLQGSMEVEGSYLEFGDLCYPMEPNVSGYGISNRLFDHTLVLPVLEGGDSLGCNWDPSSAGGDSIYAPQSLERGVFHDPQLHYNVMNPEFQSPRV